MERKIASIMNMNFWLTIFLLMNCALKVSYKSYQDLAIRFIIIIICLGIAKLLQVKITKLFYLNGLKVIFKLTLVITVWWLILKLILPNQVYFSSLALVFCLLMFFSQYQGYFYHRIETERIPFFSLILPLLIIILAFLILLSFKEYQKAITTLVFTIILYMSFKLKKIVKWRNIFLFIVVLMLTTLTVYIYYNPSLLHIDLKLNYNPLIPISLFGKGLGKSSFINDANFTYNSLNIVRLFADEFGLVGVIYANISGIFLLTGLFQTNKLVCNCKESYRLLCLGISWALLNELVIYNLAVFNIINMGNVIFPLFASNIDYIWWNLGLGMVRGVLNKSERLRQMSHLNILSI